MTIHHYLLTELSQKFVYSKCKLDYPVDIWDSIFPDTWVMFEWVDEIDIVFKDDGIYIRKIGQYGIVDRLLSDEAHDKIKMYNRNVVLCKLLDGDE